MDGESEEGFLPITRGLAHADARRPANALRSTPPSPRHLSSSRRQATGDGREGGRLGYVELVGGHKVCLVQGLGDGEGLAELAGPRAQVLASSQLRAIFR